MRVAEEAERLVFNLYVIPLRNHRDHRMTVTCHVHS